MEKKETEGQKVDTGEGVYTIDGKFFCSDCAREVRMEDVCPLCHKEIDWEKVRWRMHRTA